MEDIPDILSEQHNNQIEWEIDLVVDPLTGYAERVEEIFKRYKRIMMNENGITY